MKRTMPSELSECQRDWEEPFDLAAQDVGPVGDLDGTIHGLLLSLAETMVAADVAVDRPRAKKTALPKWSDFEPENNREAIFSELRKVNQKLGEIASELQQHTSTAVLRQRKQNKAR